LQVAALLRDHCGADAAAARVGDAHFAVLRRTAGGGELTVWLNTLFSLLHRVDQDPAAGRRSLEIHAGVYELTPADRDAAAALFNAEQGCWQAREAGKDYLLAGASLLSASHQLSRDLWESRQALDERQFRLFLQPITDARTGSIYGAEALVRWQHPRRGLLGPDQFIGTMEREGTIQQLDFYMFEEVCRLLASLSREGLGRLLVSCNLSAQTIDTAECFPRLRGILERYDFPRGNLIVEITESVLSRSPETRLENIRALRHLGLRLALDDFGSGYTSFSDLSLHAYDYVKLDRSLLEDSGDADRQTTLSGLIDFSHRLGLRVLCEGVEKEAQADLLGRLGCDLMQGYYFCRPLPAEEARRFFLREPGKNETLH
ncbi:GGDEF domain-containing phosphodiesterase, partial [uncultured Oscillibacter sp.]|uniref:bifunctional diguanylate cyclase/phosphodiesterase n=1 Tax=uncultured Oscillibacter sp. TaxID=876091 RepID=UPI0025E9AE9E